MCARARVNQLDPNPRVLLCVRSTGLFRRCYCCYFAVRAVRANVTTRYCCSHRENVFLETNGHAWNERSRSGNFGRSTTHGRRTTVIFSVAPETAVRRDVNSKQLADGVRIKHAQDRYHQYELSSRRHKRSVQ